jgi:hypothetical protein
MGLGYKCLGLVKLGFLGRFYNCKRRFMLSTNGYFGSAVGNMSKLYFVPAMLKIFADFGKNK